MNVVFYGKINLIIFIKESTCNMKLDDKKKKVQMKYREKIRGKKEDRNYSKKLLVIVTVIIIILVAYWANSL
ncbi:hypothetical protein [Peribacillus sp. CSMR9]|uniref:hypothetical protein n=1 Tax=Peribacillus sp. CSMR9 TaxID=2981350 RepID=UPI0029535452|nr:hypothetical protein [Peribacillus sp. CSMR9]MDV7766593.1 hypothetical protein [Peribacillus sp. CSMR9]